MDADYSFLDYSFINFANSESLLTTSQYAKVIFHNIQEKYNVNHDLICQYSLTEQFEVNSGDRVVLFKLGWQQVTDYVLFEWVAIPQDDCTFEVKFKASTLPRDINEFYQLCYISGENTVCGASIPFQFTNSQNLVTSAGSDCFVAVQMDSVNESLASTITDNTQNESFEADTTIRHETVDQIKEDTKQLQDELQKTNESVLHCDHQINDLKHEIETLKDMLRITQTDVSDLKLRMDLANEEYKKLFAEKARVEKKYDKLVKKCQTKRTVSIDSSSGSDMCDFLGELEPLPPFPLLMQ